MRLRIVKGRWFFDETNLAEQEAMLLLLLMLKPVAHKRDIIEWLWPDPDIQPLDTRLHIAVLLSRLRRRIGHQWIITCRYGWGWALVPVKIPVDDVCSSGPHYAPCRNANQNLAIR